jgi:hypothetical protein
MKDKKKILIISGIIILIVIILAIIIKNNIQNSSTIAKQTISDFSNVFELENIDNSKYKIEKAKDVKVAEKYITNKNAYKLDANVEFGERAGEIIYLRESYAKVNIFQTKYRIDELGSISSQVENYMEIFKNEALSYIGISEDDKGYSNMLFGIDKSAAKLPLGESIYNEKRLYSITYKDTETEGRNYDINFYRNENYLVCEFVKVF